MRRIPYVDEVTPAHVGRRVTIRHLVPDPDGRGQGGRRPTDVVGVLERFDGGTLVVRRRDGEAVTIDRAAVVASRLLPPRT